MTTEIITLLDGRSFRMDYDNPETLTPEQRQSVLNQLTNQLPTNQLTNQLQPSNNILPLYSYPYTTSFEYADNNAANTAGWITFTETGGSATFSVATDAFRTGAKSLKITSTTSGYLYRWVNDIFSVNSFPVTPGTTYNTSVWARASGGSADYVLVWFNASRVYIPPTTNQVSTTSSTWTQLTINATAPPLAAFCRPEFRLTGVGNVWFDDFSISTPSGTTSSGTTSSGTTSSGTTSSGTTSSGTTSSGTTSSGTTSGGTTSSTPPPTKPAEKSDNTAIYIAVAGVGLVLLYALTRPKKPTSPSTMPATSYQSTYQQPTYQQPTYQQPYQQPTYIYQQ